MATQLDNANKCYAERPCNFADTDGDQSIREFARRLAENSGMKLTRYLTDKIVWVIQENED